MLPQELCHCSRITKTWGELPEQPDSFLSHGGAGAAGASAAELWNRAGVSKEWGRQRRQAGAYRARTASAWLSMPTAQHRAWSVNTSEGARCFWRESGIYNTTANVYTR